MCTILETAFYYEKSCAAASQRKLKKLELHLFQLW